MPLPPPDTPLYNHPLPDIEEWLASRGCEQDTEDLHRWTVERQEWRADLLLDTDSLLVRYSSQDTPDSEVQRTFKYSLSREDLDEAIFSGP
jgi:hypothetical protein